MNERPWLLYGANGYTGELIAREALSRGLRPILAGRNGPAVARLAAELGLDHRTFGLADPAHLADSLAGVALVLHAAGPFLHTSRPMVAACLAAGAHYLDITGEMGIFEAIFRRHEPAQAAGVVLLPGVGFDVVPSDCLAARLHAALPEGDALTLAFMSEAGGWSRGTLKTMVESLPAAGAIRKDGTITEVPVAWDAREIPFSCGPRWAMTIPWGDVATAYRTTGIPNIRVYGGMPRKQIRDLRRGRWLLPLLGWEPFKGLLTTVIERKVTGPSEAVRERGRMHLWGEVTAPDGRSAAATLDTPEGYALTATAAVECARRVLAGEVAPGAWTPAAAFGADFVTTLPGVTAGELIVLSARP